MGIVMTTELHCISEVHMWSYVNVLVILLFTVKHNTGPVCVFFRWLKFEEDVEDGGERWSKPYVATLSLHSLFELRSCIINGTVLLDMRADSIEEIAGQFRIKGP